MTEKYEQRQALKHEITISNILFINIQTAKSKQGEFKVYDNNRLKYKLDGYSNVDNKKIAWEYNGCFWHGCLKCYNPSKLNPKTQESYKDLFLKTLSKKLYLESKGFTVISIFECDYNKIFKNEY